MSPGLLWSKAHFHRYKSNHVSKTVSNHKGKNKGNFSKSKRKSPESVGIQGFLLAAGEGFEPSHTESESAVLPLHKPAISCLSLLFTAATDIIIQEIAFLSTLFSKNFYFFSSRFFALKIPPKMPNFWRFLRSLDTQSAASLYWACAAFSYHSIACSSSFGTPRPCS